MVKEAAVVLFAVHKLSQWLQVLVFAAVTSALGTNTGFSLKHWLYEQSHLKQYDQYHFTFMFWFYIVIRIVTK